MKVVIVGDLGLAQELKEQMENDGHECMFFSDDKNDKLNDFRGFSDKIIVPIGNYKDKKTIENRAKCDGFTVVGFISDEAFISSSSDISETAIVFAKSFIGGSTRIASGTIIRSGSYVAHDCLIGSDCYISPQATIGGFCDIDDFTLVGLNSTIVPNTTVGAYSIVGAGSVVTKSFPAKSILKGNPAK